MGLKTSTRLMLIALPLLLLAGCAELDTLRERTVIQDKTIQRLQKENSEFQAAYYKIKETLDSEHSQSEKTAGQLSRELEQNKSARSKLEKDLNDQLRARNLEFEALKTESTDQRVQLEKQVAQLQRDLQTTQADRDAALTRLKETDEKLRIEMARTVELTQNLARLKVDVQTLNDRVAGLQKDVAARDTQLKGEQDARAAAEKRGADLDKTVAVGKQTLAQLQAEVGHLKKQLDEALAAGKRDKESLAAEMQTLKGKHSQELEATRTAAKKSAVAASLADDAELQAAVGPVSERLKTAAGAQVKLDRRGLRIILPSSLLFDENSTVLADRAAGVLKPVAESLRQVGGRSIRVEGHTDNQPVKDLPFKDNWGLGSARADRVRNFLMNDGGLAGSHLTVTSRAQFDPLTTNDTPEGRTKNRRVEIVVGARVE